jgi:hypothetical protein
MPTHETIRRVYQWDHTNRKMEAPHPSHSYELAEKSLQEQFEDNITIICSHNLMRAAHKVSDHHLTGRFLVTCSMTSTFFISVSTQVERTETSDPP